MAANMSVLFVCLLFGATAVFLSEADEPKRRLITKLNPDCPDIEQCGGGLAYIQAKGDDDTLHYLITSVGTPTIMVLRTKNIEGDTDNEVHVDWKELMARNMSKAITVGPKVHVEYSYGVMFTRLFQYNDTNDKADITKYGPDSTAWDVFDLKSATWQNLGDLSSDYIISLSVDVTEGPHTTISNGSFLIKFHFFDHEDRSQDMPHLQYNEDVTQFDFMLTDIDTGNISMARYAVETVMFSNDTNTNSMKIEETKSLDDEYSPGVFKLFNWLSKPSQKNLGGYVQWKPVCYTTQDRGRQDSTSVKKYGPFQTTNLDDFVDESIANAFYADLGKINIMATNFSFGLSKDGTYVKNKYIAWTGTIGYGMPPADQVSTLVIVVISVGLGIPVVLIMFGGIMVCLKKKMAKKGHRGSLSSDPLIN